MRVKSGIYILSTRLVGINDNFISYMLNKYLDHCMVYLDYLTYVDKLLTLKLVMNLTKDKFE